MKIYLLNPPFLPDFFRDARWQDTSRAGTHYYPVWMAYAAAALEERHDIRLIDAPTWHWDEEATMADIQQFQPDMVVVDSSFPSLRNDISIAEVIKRQHSEVINVLVGPPTSQFPDRILESDGIDIVARWEYDLTLRELAGALERQESLDSLKGISYRHDGVIRHNPDREPSTSEELDNIPFVSRIYRKHLNVKDYFLNYSLFPMVQVFGGRGCPFQCTFCCWAQTFTGRKSRMRSAANVVAEMRWVEENLPQVREVFFEDDTFTIDKKWVFEFTEEYKKAGVRIPWACQARGDVDYETMKVMREHNCLVMVIGFESGSDVMLQNMKKGITVERSRRFLRDARKAGMPIHANFVIGLPGETWETIAATKSFIREANADAITVAVATPFPGTEFWEQAITNGSLLEENPSDFLDEQGHQKAIISYPELSNEDIVKTVDEILRGYYLSLNYVPIALRRVFRRHGWDEFKSIFHSAKAFLRYIYDRRSRA
ncbi:B12-binding domain-containing radical SAM protein [Bacteroidota bacterium]